MTKNSSDCYSTIDRQMMVWFQEQRAQKLQPLLKILRNSHIKANGISFTALILGILSCMLFKETPTLAFCLLALHIILDGLDGPLARFRREDSPAGSFVDTFCDQLIICLTTLSFVNMGILELYTAGIYVFSYTITIAFSMIRNGLGIPYKFLVRPRFFIYFAAFIEIFFRTNTLNFACLLFSFILCLHVATGFFALKNKLKERHQSQTKSRR